MTLPSMARLDIDVDAELLASCVRDVEAEHRDWFTIMAQAATPASGTAGAPMPTDDWRTIPLRNQGGTLDTASPGGVGINEYSDTPLMRLAPEVRRIVSGLPCPVKAVRLMALAGNGRVPEHNDDGLGLDAGHARLHIPVITSPLAIMSIGGQQMHWAPGEVWYGDFQQVHSVHNGNSAKRIHVVIDCLVTEELLSAFSTQVPRQLAFINRSVVSDIDLSCAQFRAPRWLIDWDDTNSEEWMTATIRYVDRRAYLCLAGDDFARLIYTGDGHFRFYGWSDEFEIILGADSKTASFVRHRRSGVLNYATTLCTVAK